MKIELWYFLVPLPYTIYHLIYVYPKMNAVWAELIDLTGDKRLAKKLVRRSLAKYWWKGALHSYEVALNSYKRHLTQQPRQLEGKVIGSASNYRPSTDYKSRNRPNPKPLSSSHPAPEPSDASEFYTASPALLSRLNSLTHAVDVSDRLILHLASQYPERPIDWVIEKAIADLERDRQR